MGFCVCLSTTARAWAALIGGAGECLLLLLLCYCCCCLLLQWLVAVATRAAAAAARARARGQSSRWMRRPSPSARRRWRARRRRSPWPPTSRRRRRNTSRSRHGCEKDEGRAHARSAAGSSQLRRLPRLHPRQLHHRRRWLHLRQLLQQLLLLLCPNLHSTLSSRRSRIERCLCDRCCGWRWRCDVTVRV